MPPAWPGWLMTSAQLRGPKAGVLAFVSDAERVRLAGSHELGGVERPICGVSRFAAPISSFGPCLERHQSGFCAAAGVDNEAPRTNKADAAKPRKDG